MDFGQVAISWWKLHQGSGYTPAAESVQAKLPKLKLPVLNGEVTVACFNW